MQSHFHNIPLITIKTSLCPLFFPLFYLKMKLNHIEMEESLVMLQLIVDSRREAPVHGRNSWWSFAVQWLFIHLLPKLECFTLCECRFIFLCCPVRTWTVLNYCACHGLKQDKIWHQRLSSDCGPAPSLANNLWPAKHYVDNTV